MQLSGDVYECDKIRGLLVARFREKVVVGTRTLPAAESKYICGSLWQKGGVIG